MCVRFLCGLGSLSIHCVCWVTADAINAEFRYALCKGEAQLLRPFALNAGSARSGFASAWRNASKV